MQGKVILRAEFVTENASMWNITDSLKKCMWYTDITCDNFAPHFEMFSYYSTSYKVSIEDWHVFRCHYSVTFGVWNLINSDVIAVVSYLTKQHEASKEYTNTMHNKGLLCQHWSLNFLKPSCYFKTLREVFNQPVKVYWFFTGND